jgi:hypothetical protein
MVVDRLPETRRRTILSGGRYWLFMLLRRGCALLLLITVLGFDGGRLALAPGLAQQVETDPGLTTSAPPALTPEHSLSVRDFGARGDGVTNDQPAIAAAVAAAPTGGAVYFPAGTYLVQDTVKVRRGQVTLWGEGPTSVIKHGSGIGLNLGPDGQALMGIIVERLKFVGVPGKYKEDGNEGTAILIHGPKDTLINDCDFQGSGYAVNNAGDPGTTYGTRVENCRVNGWGSVAIFCNGGEQVVGCQLIQDDPDRLGERSSHGMYIHSGASDVTVSDTLIQNARKYGAQIYGEKEGSTIPRVHFQRVTFKDCANGITMQNFPSWAARAKDILIRDCHFLGAYNGPALSIKQGDGVDVLNCQIDGGPVGIALGRWEGADPRGWLSDVRITANTIRNCGIGIYAVRSDPDSFKGNVSVSGNTIVNCKVAVDLKSAPEIKFTP